jgi:hypothetical protein
MAVVIRIEIENDEAMLAAVKQEIGLPAGLGVAEDALGVGRGNGSHVRKTPWSPEAIHRIRRFADWQIRRLKRRLLTMPRQTQIGEFAIRK